MRLNLVFLLLTLVAEFGFSSMRRIGLVIDEGDPQNFSSVELAKKGLQQAEASFNIFYQIINVEKDSGYLDSIDALASRGFDLIIAVGSRANDAVCFLAPQNLQVRFVMVEGQCPPSKNLSEVDFDSRAVAELFAKFLMIDHPEKQPRFAWVEEQSGPNLDDIRLEMEAILKQSPSRPIIERYILDQDNSISLSTKIQRLGYHGVMLFASPQLQDLWLKYWGMNAPALVISGPGSKGGVRLNLRVDHAIYEAIEQSVKNKPFLSRKVYDFQNKGITIQLPKSKSLAERYRTGLDIAKKSTEKNAKQVVR